MPVLNTSSARVLDPILTTHVRGYKSREADYVGRALFPRAPITVRGQRIVRFGKESFRVYNTARAPGEDRAMARVGYTSDPVSIYQHALDGVVPRELVEEASRGPGIDLQRAATDMIMEVFRREEEYRQAVIAQNVANYGSLYDELSTNEYWDDTDSDPGAQMVTAHQAIRSNTGMRGNVLVLGPKVYDAIRRHPKLISNFYPNQIANVGQKVTTDQLAQYFDVRQVLVGNGVYMPASAADSDGFTDIWGNVAVLAYVPEVSGDGNIQVPSYGYTYYLSGYPLAEPAWFDKRNDTWRIPMTDEYAPVLTGMGAGFLFTNVLTP